MSFLISPLVGTIISNYYLKKSITAIGGLETSIDFHSKNAKFPLEYNKGKY